MTFRKHPLLHHTCLDIYFLYDRTLLSKITKFWSPQYRDVICGQPRQQINVRKISVFFEADILAKVGGRETLES